MKVVIIGAGVVGVTTAYYLAKSGHQVTVVEKEPEAAMLASGGNAGLIAPGHSFAWASPTAPKELLRSLTVEDTALRINPLKAPGMALWGLKFLRQLQAVCERMGSTFVVGKGVARFKASAGKVQAVAFDDGESLGGDVFVLSAGVQSPKIARSVGVKLPIAPAKGYSATFPIKSNGGPQMRIGAVDEELLVAWCRIGDRLRMTSSAEFTGYETTYNDHDLRLIRKLASDLLPEAAEYDKGNYRACNRPMTPDGPPILGQAGPQNLCF